MDYGVLIFQDMCLSFTAKPWQRPHSNWTSTFSRQGRILAFCKDQICYLSLCTSISPFSLRVIFAQVLI